MYAYSQLFPLMPELVSNKLCNKEGGQGFQFRWFMHERKVEEKLRTPFLYCTVWFHHRVSTEGVNLIYPVGGDPLCTLHRAEGLYIWVRCKSYMRDSLFRRKVNKVYSSYTGRTAIQDRAALSYSMGFTIE